MLIYYPYVRDISRDYTYQRLGWSLELPQAEHRIRQHVSKIGASGNLKVLLINGERVIVDGNYKRWGYIREEKLCQIPMKRLKH